MTELELKIKDAVNDALDNAEKIWHKVQHHFLTEKAERTILTSAGTIPSQIPGHPFITQSKPEVADFIALVLDIRNSTDHLLHAISGDKPSQLQRVLYETTAINAAGAVVIKHFDGGLTEYLGDGFLALFKVVDKEDYNEIYSAHNAAQCCINEALPIVNEIIDKRYKLPILKIGVGLAYSKAIVTIVGIEDNLHPKAIGECVYRASNLSGGFNEIHIDKPLEILWPKEKGGKLRFLARKIKNVDGYLIS